jgi:hypothetical protein
MSIELDALLVDVLQTRIVAEVEKRMDLDALANRCAKFCKSGGEKRDEGLRNPD